MSTIYLKVVNSNGALQQSKTFTPVRSGQPVIKVLGPNGAPTHVKIVNSNGVLQQANSFTVTRDGQSEIKVVAANGAFVSYPATAATLQSQSITTLSQYSNTELMLANDATTYANAIAFIQNNYINSSSLTVSSLADVVIVEPIANNSTIVYSTADNKYEVKELGLDGGNF